MSKNGEIYTAGINWQILSLTLYQYYRQINIINIIAVFAGELANCFTINAMHLAIFAPKYLLFVNFCLSTFADR